MIEGVHFDHRLSAADVGWKAVAVSVSDLAAMGAAPTDLLLGVSVHPDGDQAFVEGLALGVQEACEAFGIALVGGDTTRTAGARVITSVLGGACLAKPITRSGGSPGDDLWVTGTLGAAGAGWAEANPTEDQLTALRRPCPPLDFALAATRQSLIHAAMDLSDGLAADLPRLCAASQVGAVVDPDQLPGRAALRFQVRGGEDYQLLFSSAPANRIALACLADEHSVQLTRIGELTSSPSVELRGQPWPPPLFAHFEGAS